MRTLCLLIGFLFGSIPSGYIIARSKGIDLKHTGSGNVGSTNVLRTMGRGYALLTLIMDMLKCIIPVVIMSLLFHEHTDMHYLITLYTSSGAVLGHIFSPFLKFQGGKGVATSGGMLICLDPVLALATITMVFIVIIATGYVSLGSLMACVVVIVFHIVMLFSGYIPGWWFYKQNYISNQAPEIMCVISILAIVVALRHRENIKRLIIGKENKVSLRKKRGK